MNAEIIFGTVIDDTMEENIKVTVIATGLGGQERVLTKHRHMDLPMDTPEVAADTRATMEEPMTAQREEEVSSPREAIMKTEDDSSLVRSIKEAATRYEASKTESTTAPKEQVDSTNKNNGRARSIAEKLGFINFDEEELDTPSYLRRDEETTRVKHRKQS